MALTRTGPLTRNAGAVALGLAQIRVGNAATHVATATPALAASTSIGAMASTKFQGDTTFWTLESGFPMLEDLTIPIKESCALECAFKELTPYNLALARGIDPNSTPAINSSYLFVSKDSTLGTISGGVTVNNAGGVVDDTFSVLFTGATTFEVSGQASGFIGDGTVGVALTVNNGANPYFTIPAGFFTGTWADNDMVVFKTTRYIAAAGTYSAGAGSIALGGLKAPDYVRMEAVYTFPDNQSQMVIIFPRANVTSKLEIDLKAEDSAAVPITFGAKRADSLISGGNAAWDDMPLGTILFLTGGDMV